MKISFKKERLFIRVSMHLSLRHMNVSKILTVGEVGNRILLQNIESLPKKEIMTQLRHDIAEIYFVKFCHYAYSLDQSSAAPKENTLRLADYSSSDGHIHKQNLPICGHPD